MCSVRYCTHPIPRAHMNDMTLRPATIVGIPVTDDDRRNRTQFLLAMYGATWDNINRHILVVWQSVAALFAALAASYLSGKELLNPDFGTSLIVLATGWSIAHSIDSTAWYNRNLLIISNIERQFLFDADEKEIHHYFGKHRGARPIEHIMIQIVLAAVIGTLALMQHFAARVVPGFVAPWKDIDLWRAAPCVLAGVVLISLVWFYQDVTKKYKRLLSQSPGRMQPAAAGNGSSAEQ